MPDRRFLVYSGSERYPATTDTGVVGIKDLAETLQRFAHQDHDAL